MNLQKYLSLRIHFQDNESHDSFEFYYTVYRSESNRAFYDL